MFACLRFNLYLMGRRFDVITDHKPLLHMFNNPHKLGPARVERMRLRVQGYYFEVKYRPGKSNPSDFLSRHPVSCSSVWEKEEANEQVAYLNLLHSQSMPEAITLEKVREAVEADEVLCKVRSMLLDGHKCNEKDKMAEYRRIWCELSVCEGLVMRGEKIVVPESLRNDVVKIAHEGHMGMVKCKQFLRSRVWFPGMDVAMEKEVDLCIPCQAAVESSSKEAVIMSDLPSGPWEQLSMDFWGPTPKWGISVCCDR